MLVRGLLRWFWRLSSSITQVPDLEGAIVCTYIVKDPATRPTQFESWPTKTVAQNLLFLIDWSVYTDGDPIVSSVWDVDSGLSVWQVDTYGSNIMSIFVGQGSDHTTYAIRNTVTLTSTAEYTQVVKLMVDNKEC